MRLAVTGSSTISELRSRWREVTHLQLSELAVGAALPSAIGYAIPLVVGLAAGHLADGVTASVGALIVGFANLGGGYRVRGATLLATTVSCGLAALLGGLAGPSIAATVVLLGIWGFAGGLLVALGRRAAFVGMLSTWALLLVGDLHLHGEAVLREAWLLTAGGLVQTLVAIAAWPLRPWAPERRALAAAYRALAAYARRPQTGGLQSAASALAAAAETVGSDPPTTSTRRGLRRLVEIGEWIRVELVALARFPASEVQSTQLVAARGLEAIAAERSPESWLEMLARTARAITEPAARRAALSLSAWIQSAVAEGGDELALSSGPRRDTAGVLRAELTLRSSAFRHALRLSVALMAAAIVYRGLSLSFGYWVPLTVLFVLKPDYGSTTTRALGRMGGTMVGVTLAWAVVSVTSPSDGAIVALLAVLAAVGYALYPANYALFSVVLTVVIALLVQFSGGSPVGALGDRLLDTVVGGAIAMAAVVAWPTPEGPRGFESLAAYVGAQQRWLHSILASFWNADAVGRLRSQRLAVRTARVEARDAVRRALDEPPRRRPDPGPLRAVLTTMDDISESGLALAAIVHDGARAPQDQLEPFARELDTAFDRLATSLRSGTWTPPSPPPLDATLHLDGSEPGVAAVALEAAAIVAAWGRLERVSRAVD